jgi:hypothetical protein
MHPAYVGITDRLRHRIVQHLINRDSSVTTGTSAAVLNPDYVTEVRWWADAAFSERHVLEAAELVVAEELQPTLRSRGRASEQAKTLFGDVEFRGRILKLVRAVPVKPHETVAGHN